MGTRATLSPGAAPKAAVAPAMRALTAVRPFAQEGERAEEAPEGWRGPAFSFGKVPLYAKPAVGQPGDALDVEAHQDAERVMRVPDPAAESLLQGAAGTPQPAVQRMCATCEEEEGERSTVQRRETPGAANGGAVAEPGALAAAGLAAPAGPLPHLNRIQAAFGRHDVSSVQAHVGGEAARASDALHATAYAYGDHVAFKEAPDVRTAAHEAAHVIQQRGGVQVPGGLGRAGDRYEQNADAVADAVAGGGSAEALLGGEIVTATRTAKDIQRQEAGSSLSFDVPVQVTSSGAETTLTLPDLPPHVHRVHLIAEDPSLQGHPAFAWELLPAEPEAGRNWRILRIVAAPGVRVVPEGWPATFFAGPDNPELDIYRVQDRALVPPQGQPIVPSRYVGVTTPGAESPGPLALEPTFTVSSTMTRVEIAYVPGNVTVVIDVRNLASTDRFAYELNPGDVFALGPTGHAEIRIVKTPTVPILVRAPTGALPVAIRVFEVPNVADVPPQGRAIHPVGRELTTLRAQALLTPEQQVARIAFPILVSLIPVVGEIYMIADFVYGVRTGHDLAGNELDTEGRILSGLGALLGFVGLGLRGVSLIARALRRAPAQAEQLAAAVRSLSAEDRATVSRLQAVAQRGEPLTAVDVEALTRILRQIDGQATRAAAGERELDALLNAERNGFADPEVQAAYQRYRARGVESQLGPAEWLRQTDEGRAAAANALGLPEARAARSAAETVTVADAAQRGTATERVVASFRTSDGLHEIKLLEDGSLVRCSAVCAHLRAFFNEVLSSTETAADRALSERFREIETRARSTNPTIREDAAREAAALEPALRARGGELIGRSLSLPPEAIGPFLRLYPMDRVYRIAELVRFYAGRGEATRTAFARAIELADEVGRAEIVHLLELNQGSRLSNAGLERSLSELVGFLERYPGRLTGDFASRYFRLVTNEPAQAAAELRLAEDILEGRTPFGAGRSVEGLTTDAQGVRLPEYAIGGGERATPQFAEVKRLEGSLAGDAFDRNLRSAIDQIHSAAEQARATAGGGALRGEGLIRLDAQASGRTALTTEELRAQITSRLRASDPDRLVRWVEVLYLDRNGRSARVLFRVQPEPGGLFRLVHSGG